MKKVKLLHLLLAGVWLFLAGCEEDPYVSFTVSSSVVAVNETVTFSNSSIDADHFEWYFGDGTTSTVVNPTHSYSKEGAYIVTLVGYSKSGNKKDDAYQFYLYVLNPREVTFTNPTYTPIDITIDGFEMRTIPIGGSTTYQVFTSNINLNASTTEKFSNGTPLGLTITWTGEIELPNNTQTFNLNVGTDFYYLHTTNYSEYTLGPIHTNWGTNYQVTINCQLPSDGIKYNLGYHYAQYENEMRFYVNTTQYFYAYRGTHFNYPNVINQSVSMTCGAKGLEKTKYDIFAFEENQEQPLIVLTPTEKVTFKKEKGSIDIISDKIKPQRKN